ncbi:DnaD/phage-associated family protein [Cytobacillus horneckiae]|uniref:DnaD domain-containing protein n=1 Tax=Cytobacillus horneckiae TaxID=549687 RepID=UPI0019D0F93E|nr:DnaD domain protein [Cytobacillus horneckiae]MBN6889932.1 DnaD domain protein [Cytobacillus horneckiae]
MNGWIKLHRKLLTSKIFENEKLLKIFIYCLMKATHSDHQQIVGKQIIDLKPGEFVFGRKKAALELDMKESTVRDYIKLLKNDNVISVTPTNKFSVISIINWEVYQSKGDDSDNKMTTTRQQNDSKMTAEGQQNDTNKNVKNVENEKKNNTTTAENPVQLFEQLLCRLSPIQMNSIYQWVDDFKGNEEIINAAIKLADDRNKRNFGFVEFLLKEWFNNNLMTIDRVRAYEQEKFNKNKVKQYPRKGAVRTEMLPDWFDENEKKDKPKLKVVDDNDKKMSEFEELMEQRKKMSAGS